MTDRRAIRRGAVLYDRRPKTRRLDPTSERALVHVTGVYEETTTGNRLIKLQDGTHTHYQMLHAVDLRDSFIPAGWSFPIGRKPTYHLTRNCGVDDKADLMTDGGEEVGQAIARERVEDVSELSAASDTLGEDLEALLDERGVRGETGSYYTPDYIIEYIVEETVGRLVEEYDDLDDISVLDPACGAGDFLLGALDFIATERQARDPELSERAAYEQTAATNLYGVDRLPEAVAVTKHRIRRAVADTPGDAAVDGLGLDERIKQGNSLVGSSPADLPVDVGEVVA